MPRRPLTIACTAALTAALLTLGAAGAWAGSLDAPAAPNNAGSAMYTLESLSNRLDTGAAGSKRGATFAEPAAAPGSTMVTLDQIMAKLPAVDATNGAAPGDVTSGKTYWGLTAAGWGPRTGTGAGGGASAAVPKTGQTTSNATGDDGDLEKGVAWPSPRFTDNGNGTVTDNLSGLIWLKNANCFATQTWANALAAANTLNSGECSLSDGSVEGAWRLPNIKELHSLVDFGRYNPALPSGHPFSGVQVGFYWSSTSSAVNTSNAWYLYLYGGYVYYDAKTGDRFVWPVRGGQ